jgi:ABC-type uncharacterized transport system permease subunit
MPNQKPKKSAFISMQQGLAKTLDFINKHTWAMAFIVIFLGFLTSTLLLMAAGRDPDGMYGAMLQTITGFDNRRNIFNVRYIGEWLTLSTPLILCGLSVAFALKAGLFNIGAEGQYIMGLTFAQFAAFYFPHIPVLHALAACLLAAAAGALWGGIVGYLKGKYQVSEVVATIMLNYIAFYFTRWFTPATIAGTNSFNTPPLPQTARLAAPWLQELTNRSQLNYGFFIMLAALVIYHIIINKTALGLSLRATGFNPVTARFSGISTVKSSFTSMAIAGAFAGLAGAVIALGSFTSGRVIPAQDQYGFNGIAVALVAAGNAVGIFFSGLLFGMLSASQSLMSTRQIPKEITSIISGLIVIFISLTIGLKYILAKVKLMIDNEEDKR